MQKPNSSECICTRPVNIRVFMYLGRVCNLRAGTLVPVSLGLRRNQRFFAAKTRWKWDLSDSRIFKSVMCQIHEFTHTEILFFWNYLPLFCLFIITWCKNHENKHREKYQNGQLLFIYTGTRVVNSYLDPESPGGYPGILPGLICTHTKDLYQHAQQPGDTFMSLQIWNRTQHMPKIIHTSPHLGFFETVQVPPIESIHVSD